MAAPTAPQDRIAFLDVLRGFAILGILTMNITLGQPGATRLNPLISGGFEGANLWTWLAGYFLFDEKMITLLSMLYGAGMVLFTSHRHDPWLFYRRSFILLGIGLAHAYGLWEGDILVTYAICGMLVYPLRRYSTRTLLWTAVALWLVAVPLSYGFGSALAAERTSGSPLWREVQSAFQPDAAETAREIHTMRTSGYLQIAARRAPEALRIETLVFGLSFLWTVSARMLIGIVLLRERILTGERDTRFYARTALTCYAIGWTFVAVACRGLLSHEFDPVYLFRYALLTNGAGSIFVAIGHMSLLALLFRSGWVQFVIRRLEAVGRMALTNYLAQTVIATTLFYGYGFALYGQLSRLDLYFVVLLIWLLQLWYSPIWLKSFQLGPVEWIWRSWTYGRMHLLVTADPKK